MDLHIFKVQSASRVPTPARFEALVEKSGDTLQAGLCLLILNDGTRNCLHFSYKIKPDPTSDNVKRDTSGAPPYRFLSPVLKVWI